jgi:hypothetical protein|nr:hypothetical protein [uncultured Capnocytophaga sp.]
MIIFYYFKSFKKNPDITPEQANKFLQEELIPDLKEKIIKAKDSGMNLTEYFNFSNK